MVIEVLNWAVSVSTAPPAPSPAPAARGPAGPAPSIEPSRHRLRGDRAPLDAAVYDRAMALRPATLTGPALIAEPQTTTYVSADFGPRSWTARATYPDPREEAPA
jgi:N-methylhydantoinase A